MTPRPVDETPGTQPPRNRLRHEFLLGSIWLAIGLFVVPAMVYWVGTALLGPYGDGIGTFYGSFFADLASGVGRAWTLALGPLLLISLLRLIFMRRPTADQPEQEDAAPRQPRPAASSADRSSNRRVEPRVTLD